MLIFFNCASELPPINPPGYFYFVAKTLVISSSLPHRVKVTDHLVTFLVLTESWVYSQLPTRYWQSHYVRNLCCKVLSSYVVLYNWSVVAGWQSLLTEQICFLLFSSDITSLLFFFCFLFLEVTNCLREMFLAKIKVTLFFILFDLKEIARLEMFRAGGGGVEGFVLSQV